MLKFFQERSKKDEEKYLKFYDDYGLFFREGIVSTHDQAERVSCVPTRREKGLTGTHGCDRSRHKIHT